MEELGAVMTFEEALDRNGFIAYTNVGVSMMPLLREGRDVMVIQKREKQRLSKLDAVLFIRPNVEGRGHYVLHRILKVLPEGYWIVGDNCVYGEYVKEENVIGVLTSVMRDGKALDFASPGYRLYVRLWCAPWRFRFAVLRLRSFVRRAGSFFLRKVLRIRRKAS